MKCKICNSDTSYVFQKKILNKHTVSYYKCETCSFIQTEEPYWLSEAYSEPISYLDIGILQRNINLSQYIERLLLKNFNYRASFLDYGGGYGIFVRLMRDKGFDFYRYDKYCQNIFCKFFDIEDKKSTIDFEIVTAIEVFEHMKDPIDEIKKIFDFSDTIMFTTELQSSNDINIIKDWWYLAPEGGQHISFYSLESLKYIAKYFECNLYINNSIHILTKTKKSIDFIENNTNKTLIEKIKDLFNHSSKVNESFTLDSLIESDYKKMINIYKHAN